MQDQTHENATRFNYIEFIYPANAVLPNRDDNNRSFGRTGTITKLR